MEFIAKAIEKYCEDHTTAEDEILQHINRQTNLKVQAPRMLSGHLQGGFLTFIAKIKGPRRVLEIGTFTGYSTLCLIKGLTKDGLIYTIDANEELAPLIKSNIEHEKERIQFICGDAQKVIPTINEKWDLVFIDADKENYSLYYDLVFENLNEGGIILADNVLWSGKVLDDNDKDKSTDGIKEFNRKIKEDDRIEKMLLPLRDGIMMIIKK